MRKVTGFLLVSVCVVSVVSLLVAPQPKIQHQDSSAFEVALQQAVERLESGGKTFLAGTATPAKADAQQFTFGDGYTCETFDRLKPTCDPQDSACTMFFPHTSDPQGVTCVQGAYTCQMATCDTYDPQQLTCDPYDPQCGPVPPPPHTFEPPPYHHTCEGHTCDGSYTCDFTIDPRAPTCDAADPVCHFSTFDAFALTCNPMLPECRLNNPNHCTAQGYPTCDPSVPTCDATHPSCATIDPTQPGCATPAERTTWGKIKHRYKER